MFKPTEETIAELEFQLRTFEGDVNQICNYYFDLGFQACMIYNDAPELEIDWHLYLEDHYMYILQGQKSIQNNDETINLQAGDLFFVPATVLHKSNIGQTGAKYIVASMNRDFSMTKGEMKV